jgi:hypothetical protein
MELKPGEGLGTPEDWRQNPRGFWRNPYFDMELFMRKMRAEIRLALELDRMRDGLPSSIRLP